MTRDGAKGGNLLLRPIPRLWLWPNVCGGASPVTGERRSLRKIAAMLAEAGFLNERGCVYAAKTVLAMIES